MTGFLFCDLEREDPPRRVHPGRRRGGRLLAPPLPAIDGLAAGVHPGRRGGGRTAVAGRLCLQGRPAQGGTCLGDVKMLGALGAFLDCWAPCNMILASLAGS